MGWVRGLMNVVGRILLCVIFGLAAIHSIFHFDQVAADLSGLPADSARLVLVAVIVFLILGSFFVVTGFAARLGAALLLATLVLATYCYLDFWHLAPDDPERNGMMSGFFGSLGLGGALLLVLANGVRAGMASFSDLPDERDLDY